MTSCSLHAHAGHVDGGKAPHQVREEAGLDFVTGADVLGAHGHDLRAEGQQIAFLGDGQHILADDLGLVLAHLDEVGLNRIAGILAAVAGFEAAAVKMGDAVLFAALFFQIA